jgi:hypothetical protein
MRERRAVFRLFTTSGATGIGLLLVVLLPTPTTHSAGSRRSGQFVRRPPLLPAPLVRVDVSVIRPRSWVIVPG